MTPPLETEARKCDRPNLLKAHWQSSPRANFVACLEQTTGLVIGWVN